MGKQRHCCNSAVNDVTVTKQSKCNNLQGQEQGLANKAKDLTFKAKARDLTFKAKAKDLKIVLKISLRARPRTPITGYFKVCSKADISQLNLPHRTKN